MVRNSQESGKKWKSLLLRENEKVRKNNVFPFVEREELVKNRKWVIGVIEHAWTERENIARLWTTVGLFSMPEQGKKSEFVQTGQLKNILAEVMKEKNKAKSTALKRRQKTIEY